MERVDFNSDNAKIDGALHALAEQAGRKADKSTVTNLSSVVSQKADKTALTAAEKRVSALERGKAEQVALDGAVSQLREENRMVFLGRTALNTAASSFDSSGPGLDRVLGAPAALRPAGKRGDQTVLQRW